MKRAKQRPSGLPFSDGEWAQFCKGVAAAATQGQEVVENLRAFAAAAGAINVADVFGSRTMSRLRP